MILEFSIANFLSFKDKVTFSMFANSTSGLDENYIISNGRKILKTAAIYGANASGKTNLFINSLSSGLVNGFFILFDDITEYEDDR